MPCLTTPTTMPQSSAGSVRAYSFPLISDETIDLTAQWSAGSCDPTPGLELSCLNTAAACTNSDGLKWAWCFWNRRQVSCSARQSRKRARSRASSGTQMSRSTLHLYINVMSALESPICEDGTHIRGKTRVVRCLWYNEQCCELSLTQIWNHSEGGVSVKHRLYRKVSKIDALTLLFTLLEYATPKS